MTLRKNLQPSPTRPFFHKDAKRRYTLGVVYEPNVPDTDNEYADAAEIEKACWRFMRYLQASGEAHKAAAEIVEKLFSTCEESGPDAIEIDITDLQEYHQQLSKRGVNDMHVDDLDDCDVVECYIAPQDVTIGDQKVTKGTWLLGVVWSPELFAKIQNGERMGYSMGGFAQRQGE